jgi:hypothetical protein
VLGCATLPAAMDVVVPSPLSEVEFRPGAAPNEIVWIASYGKEPQKVKGYPVHVHLTRSGRVTVPESLAACEAHILTAPPQFSSYDALQPGAGCIYQVTSRGDDGERAVFLLDGADHVVQRTPLPRDIPVLHAKRWAWLAAAPVVDAFWFSVLTVTAVVAVPLYPFRDVIAGL